MSPLLAIHVPAIPAILLLAQADGVTWPQVGMAFVLMVPGLLTSILAYKAANRAAEGAKAAAFTAGVAVEVGKDNQKELVKVQHAVVENTDKTTQLAVEQKETKTYIDGMRSELCQEIRGRGLAEGREQGAAAEQERVAVLQETKPPEAGPVQSLPSGTAAVAAAAAAGATKATAAEMTRIATATEETAENTRKDEGQP